MNINLRGGLALIRGTWLSWLEGRAFFFLLAFGWMISPLISLFVWYTAAGGNAIGGLTQREFVTYYLVFIFVNQLTYSQTNWTVGDGIRSGAMTLILLRPLPPLFGTIAAEVAGKVVLMLFVIPISLVLAVLLHPELHTSPLNIVLFLVTLLLAWLLRFFWGYWIALLAFWATRADALLSVQEALVFLFAGQVAPLALLPISLQGVADVLPFRYMISFPIEILLGKLNTTQLLLGLAYQLGWLVVACVLYNILWRRGVRRYTAVGG
jgi:ABC-2 type transport system permease protein